ncbi:MAG: hypothetical protein FJ088_07455 [Deltaproteobacteria bacterium]|nr:hypothetical protein [Deltaproteobacteria bacterium]
MKTCPKCSTTWPDDASFCPMHGMKLIEVKEQKSEKSKPEIKAAQVQAKAKPEKSRVDLRTASKADAVPKAKKAAGSQWFSETKWFQVGDKIKEEEVTPEDIPLDDLDKIYKKTSELPEDVRKKYSLSYKDKEKKDK